MLTIFEKYVKSEMRTWKLSWHTTNTTLRVNSDKKYDMFVNKHITARRYHAKFYKSANMTKFYSK